MASGSQLRACHQLRPSPRLRQTSDHHPHFSEERSEDQGGDTPSQRLLDLPRRQLLWARLEAVATDSSGPPPSSTSEPSIPQVSPQSQRGQGWFISQGRRGHGLRASPWGCRALGAGHFPGGVSCSLQSRSPPTLQGSRARHAWHSHRTPQSTLLGALAQLQDGRQGSGAQPRALLSPAHKTGPCQPTTPTCTCLSTWQRPRAPSGGLARRVGRRGQGWRGGGLLRTGNAVAAPAPMGHTEAQHVRSPEQEREGHRSGAQGIPALLVPRHHGSWAQGLPEDRAASRGQGDSGLPGVWRHTECPLKQGLPRRDTDLWGWWQLSWGQQHSSFTSIP